VNYLLSLIVATGNGYRGCRWSWRAHAL